MNFSLGDENLPAIFISIDHSSYFHRNSRENKR